MHYLKIYLPAFSLFFCFIISGCASSPVSREAAAGVDLGARNAKLLYKDATDGSFADTYQNSTQATKGAFIGGAAGALTGYATTGVGVLPGTAIGAILGASFGSYIDAYSTPRDELINRGVNVITLGDQILIEVPSSRIFRPFSPYIKPQAYSTIEMIADYMNKFIKTTVKVAVYTPDTGSKTIDLALSQQQADNVAKILLRSQLNSRLLYAVGCGSSQLVVRNSLDWEGNENYRIEITFEKLPV